MRYLILTAVLLTAPAFAEEIVEAAIYRKYVDPVIRTQHYLSSTVMPRPNLIERDVRQALEHVDRIDLALRLHPTLRPQLAIDPKPIVYSVGVEIVVGRDVSILSN